MNKAANTYWTDARLAAQRPAARALTLVPAPAGEFSHGVVAVGGRVETRRRGPLVPSWVLFSMIILATFALCVTVTMRTHAGMREAAQKYELMDTEVRSLRQSNAVIESEVQRLRRKNKHAVEEAARERLNMVRADELVVPVE